jgi:hypothetical protein
VPGVEGVDVEPAERRLSQRRIDEAALRSRAWVLLEGVATT